MAAIYQRAESTRFIDPKMMIMDFKFIADSAWEGYSKGYAAERAKIDNAKNDAMFFASLRQGNPLGLASRGSRSESILDTQAVTRDPLKTPGFTPPEVNNTYVGPKTVLTGGLGFTPGSATVIQPVSQIPFGE